MSDEGNVDIQERVTGAPAQQLGAVPQIQLPGDGRTVSQFVSDLVPVLKDKGIFRRDTVPVVAYVEQKRLEVLDATAFVTWIEQFAVCFKKRFEDGKPYKVIRSMPGEVSEKTLGSWGFWTKMPNIKRVNLVPKPVLHGKVIALPSDGYDMPSQTLTFKSDSPYNESLTLEQATDYLRGLFSEFPFEDWKETPIADEAGGGVLRQSRGMAVQLAAMFSQFADQIVPANAPKMGFIWNANTPRSGKTLLAKLVVVPVNGHVAIQSWNAQDEELKKVLDAEVLRASSYIFFDNIRGHMASQVLEGFMTSPNWTGRVLGQTKMFTAENTATLLMTGNDCTVSQDMNYRCLRCDLFVAESNASDRSIKHVIDDTWLLDWKNRNAVLSALWTIVRHWDAAGRPPPKALPRTGFEAWCKVIAGLVEFAGFGDCLEDVSLDGAGDNETTDTRALLKHLIAEMHPEESQIEFTFQQIVNICYQEGLFDWVIDGKKDGDDFILKHDFATRFGKILKRSAPPLKRRIFRFEAGRVGFGTTGKNRHRRFVVSIVKEDVN